MSSHPTLDRRETAAACGVSRTTIRRRREAGALPGAVEDPHRGWLIPVDDLLGAGLRLHAPSPPNETAPPEPSGPEGQPAVPGPDVVALQAELERMRHAHALAVTEAQHLREQLVVRGEHVADLRATLAVLMPAPAGSHA
ncbi:helix-turn-helix transcriptional regulator [Micromonospora sp. NPDC050397]|uniref:helix-turn-helix transcriptional regulator n=1 Tax=Micromonospora sp. NPDC050397 TaxID=3364279 RepID=UPI00384EE8F7